MVFFFFWSPFSEGINVRCIIHSPIICLMRMKGPKEKNVRLLHSAANYLMLYPALPFCFHAILKIYSSHKDELIGVSLQLFNLPLNCLLSNQVLITQD